MPLGRRISAVVAVAGDFIMTVGPRDAVIGVVFRAPYVLDEDAKRRDAEVYVDVAFTPPGGARRVVPVKVTNRRHKAGQPLPMHVSRWDHDIYYADENAHSGEADHLFRGKRSPSERRDAGLVFTYPG